MITEKRDKTPMLGEPAPFKRFMPRPPFASAEFDIVGLGYRESMRSCLVDRPRGTDDWLLMVFDQPVTIGQPSGVAETAGPVLMVWQPLAPHLYGRTDRVWNHSWMHITGTAVTRLVGLAGIPIDRPIPEVALADVEACVLALNAEIASDRPDPVIGECCLRILLHQVARAARGGAHAIPPGLIAARQRIEERFAEPVQLPSLARLAGLSVNHFCTAFRQAFGLTPYDFALRLRLERARMLLRDRNRSIADIAAEVGYDDPASFARLVRRRLGSGPRALR